VDVLTAQEDGQGGTRDPDLLDRAGILERVVFTRDEDFLVEAGRRWEQGIPFAGVIFAPQLEVGIGKCIEDLELIAKVNTWTEMVSTLSYLPL
jgi:hypothetical protein